MKIQEAEFNQEVRMKMLKELLQRVDERNKLFEAQFTIPVEDSKPEHIAYDNAMKVI